MVRDLGATFDRFKRDPRGGHFSNTTADNNGFKTKLPMYQVPLNKEDIVPIGRPLWVRETGQTDKDTEAKKKLNATPAPATYNIRREFDKETKIISQAKSSFGLPYKNLKKVSYNPQSPYSFSFQQCDLDRGLKNFDYSHNT